MSVANPDKRAASAFMDSWMDLQDVASKLSRVSRAQRYEVYELFDWPESLPLDSYWMSPELTTCHGTPVWEELDERRRIVLSQHEAVAFFSLNVHLIRDLIGEVASRIYSTRFPGLSEFFHDFIHEENEHMWFFAQFCQRYGGKVYSTREVASRSTTTSETIQDLLVFGRILIAEELCDVFNARMAKDERLPPIARQINAVHHSDESRHIAFGRQMMRALGEEAARRSSPDELRSAGEYLARYISVCLRSFYNTAVYIDTGLSGARSIRSRLLADPARQAMHRQTVGRTVAYLERIDILDSGMVAW